MLKLIHPYAPLFKTGCLFLGVEMEPLIHHIEQRFGLSQSTMEEALRDITLGCEFAQLVKVAPDIIPDGSNHLLQASNLSVEPRGKFNYMVAQHDRDAGMYQVRHQDQGAVSTRDEQVSDLIMKNTVSLVAKKILFD